ncbi:MAG: hypothetical protein JWO02_407 [Solirubrobacterales bacterium]|nr:hypothetical protein [Solirubrobacterales bacterium]
MALGLLLALVAALATNLSFLFKQRGAVLAPEVQFRHPLHSAAALFRSRWFAIGWLVALVAWGLHVGALAGAPLSIVQAVLGGGLVFLAILGDRYFGLKLGRRQWIGVTITAAGLAVIALTGGLNSDAARPYSLAALIAIESGVLVAGATVLVLATRRDALSSRPGLVLGAAAGALFGVSDIALKYLTHAVGGGLLGLLSPWTGAAILASIIAFFASARALQIGPGLEVIALTSLAANLTATIGGILVFREPLGNSSPAVVARLMAFGLVIAGGALIPSPTRTRRPHRWRAAVRHRRHPPTTKPW